MLYDYQKKSVETIRNNFLNGTNKVLLHLPTGAGKTVVFCWILKKIAEKNIPAIMIVQGRKLVSQGSERLAKWEVPHDVVMAGKDFNAGNPIKVCSYHTLIARGEVPPAEYIVVDEAHQATSQKWIELLSKYPKARIIAVTATPYVDRSLEHLAQTVIAPIDFAGLVAKKKLCPPKYFCPDVPSLKGVKIQAGEYNQKDLSAVMQENKILFGSISKHYKKLAMGRRAIAFCVSRKHGKSLCQRLNESEIPSGYIDGDTPDDERLELISKLQKKEILVLCNVGVLCTGVDIPEVEAIIMARPTLSLSLFIQQAGRGSRICDEIGKKDFILLDHAGNVARHGFLTDAHPVDLKAKEKGPAKAQAAPVSICEECFTAFRGRECPECGFEKITIFTESFKESDDQLKEVKPEKIIDPGPVDLFWVKAIYEKQKILGHKRGWVWFQLKSRYGEKKARKYYAKEGDFSFGRFT
jgi:superfamily II DNA or RNA helicase